MANPRFGYQWKDGKETEIMCVLHGRIARLTTKPRSQALQHPDGSVQPAGWTTSSAVEDARMGGANGLPGCSRCSPSC